MKYNCILCIEHFYKFLNIESCPCIPQLMNNGRYMQQKYYWRTILFTLSENM